MREFNTNYEMMERSLDLAERIAELELENVEENEVLNIFQSIDQLLHDMKPGTIKDQWQDWVMCAKTEIAKRNMVTAAASGEDGVSDAKARFDVMMSELEQRFAPCSNIENKIQECITNPLPTVYWKRDTRWDGLREQMGENGSTAIAEEDVLPTVGHLLVFNNDLPLATPQELKTKTLYNLRFETRLNSCPSILQAIRIRMLSTLGADQYSISPLEDGRVIADADDFVSEVCCTIAFPYSQDDPFAHIVFAIAMELVLENGEIKSVSVIGYDQLRFRVRDEAQTLLSNKYPAMDTRVHELLQNLFTTQPKTRSNEKDLVPFLDAIATMTGVFAQGGIWKGRKEVTEAEFQEESLKILRAILGQEVLEGRRQAGGITDITYKSCIAELKVESKLTSPSDIIEKYGSQAAQYASSEGRSVSMLLVLDLVEKQRQPGNVQGDIHLQKIESHQDQPGFESWIFLFIVRGNTKNPSSYSS